MARVTRRRWFLPETPDVLGTLSQQAAVTVEGMEALVSWAGGEGAAADRLRDAEHRADERKRALREELTTAFTTPLEPEDIFTLSEGLDAVLNGAKNLVREAEVMRTGPDPATADMAGLLLDGVRRIEAAFAALQQRDRGAATAAADEAVKSQRNVERAYRAAMSSLVEEGDLRAVAARRELYRRLARSSDGLVAVAERVWYAVLKDS